VSRTAPDAHLDPIKHLQRSIKIIKRSLNL